MIGPVPANIFFLLFVIVWALVYLDALPITLFGGLAVILTLGWLLNWIGSIIPVFNRYGGGTIMCLLGGPLLLYWGIIPDNAMAAIEFVVLEADFLNLYVYGLIIGSIMGIERNLLVQGFMRIAIPVLLGYGLSTVLATGAGALMGINWQEALFTMATPTMAGGLSGGVLPYAEGLSDIFQMNYGDLIAVMAPAQILSNFMVIFLAAIFNNLGKKYPDLTGDGVLVRPEALKNKIEAEDQPENFLTKLESIGLGLLLVIAFYLLGNYIAGLIQFPATVLVIIAAVVFKYFRILPFYVEEAFADYSNMMSSLFTAPIILSLGLLYFDIANILQIITLPFIIVILIVCLVLALVGFFVGGKLGMYPIESAIVIINMAAMGGTGNISVLNTAERQELMPYAQVANKIGGTINVTLMIILARFLA